VAMVAHSRGDAATEELQRAAAPQQMEKVQYMPVQYVKAAPARGKQAVRYVEVPQGTKLAAAPRGRQQGRTEKVEYVMMPQKSRRVRVAPRRVIHRQQLRVGGAGVKKGYMLDDEPEAEAEPEADAEAEPEADAEAEPEADAEADADADAEAGEEEGGDEAPAAVTPPTPEEIAKALQRIQERQIQEQTFHDTLVDAQTGQPLHVPGVAGSAHNGVSGIGGIFGVGGFLGPDYPISDSMQPAGAVSSGPACTCTSCTGSPPVCTGCTCRR